MVNPNRWSSFTFWINGMSVTQDNMYANLLQSQFVCHSCGLLKPRSEFYEAVTMCFNSLCASCRMAFIKSMKWRFHDDDSDLSEKQEKTIEQVPEHLLSRAFKIKHYFVGLKVVPQARWIAVSDNFKFAEKTCCIAKPIFHRTLLKDCYHP